MLVEPTYHQLRRSVWLEPVRQRLSEAAPLELMERVGGAGPVAGMRDGPGEKPSLSGTPPDGIDGLLGLAGPNFCPASAGSILARVY